MISKILFLSITETGQFVETRRLFVDFTLFQVLHFCDPADFIYSFIFSIENNDYKYTVISFSANETVLINVQFVCKLQ